MPRTPPSSTSSSSRPFSSPQLQSAMAVLVAPRSLIESLAQYHLLAPRSPTARSCLRYLTVLRSKILGSRQQPPPSAETTRPPTRPQSRETPSSDGVPSPTLQQVEESAARKAIGGMRAPVRSLHRVPGACVVGERIRHTLDEFIANHENTRTPVERILEGLPTLGFEVDEVLAARSAI